MCVILLYIFTYSLCKRSAVNNLALMILFIKYHIIRLVFVILSMGLGLMFLYEGYFIAIIYFGI